MIYPVASAEDHPGTGVSSDRYARSFAHVVARGRCDISIVWCCLALFGTLKRNPCRNSCFRCIPVFGCFASSGIFGCSQGRLLLATDSGLLLPTNLSTGIPKWFFPVAEVAQFVDNSMTITNRNSIFQVQHERK